MLKKLLDYIPLGPIVMAVILFTLLPFEEVSAVTNFYVTARPVEPERGEENSTGVQK
jgi:hypothetical protein